MNNENETLDTAAQALSFALQEAERLMQTKLGCRTRAEVTLPSGVKLAWLKRNDRQWALHIIHGGDEPQPMSSAPISVRIEASKMLNSLVTACKSAEATLTHAAREAAEHTRRLTRDWATGRDEPASPALKQERGQ